MTAQLVHDLELPTLNTIGLERLEALAAIEDALVRALAGPDRDGLLRDPPR